MKKMIAIFCCAIMLTMPAMADRTTSPVSDTSANTSNFEYCSNNPDKCSGGRKTHAKKNSNTTTIIVASVAVGAVFAGAMWYFFKKTPSENNPGQVKLASF